MIIMATGYDTERPLTDLERLQLKANQVTDESLESTRRMVVLCEEVRPISLSINDLTLILIYVKTAKSHYWALFLYLHLGSAQSSPVKGR